MNIAVNPIKTSSCKQETSAPVSVEFIPWSLVLKSVVYSWKLAYWRQREKIATNHNCAWKYCLIIGDSFELSRQNGCRKSEQLEIKRKFWGNSLGQLKLASHVTESVFCWVVSFKVYSLTGKWYFYERSIAFLTVKLTVCKKDSCVLFCVI